jgi:menaquinone-dependent protoporphyrinogen IX oxidase
MRFLILYKTRYQSAKAYALWLKEELKNTDAVNVNQYKSIEVENYDCVIIGSSVDQNRLSILDFLNEHLTDFEGKSIYLFSVGVAYPFEKRRIDLSEQFSPELKARLAGYYHLPGRFNFSKLGWGTRILFWLRGIKENDVFISKKKLMPMIRAIKNDFELR